MGILEVIILKLFLLLFSLPAQASTAEDVVDRYLNVIGGQHALNAIQTLTYTRELEHKENNRITRIVYYQKRPHFWRSRPVGLETGVIISGDDAWRAHRDASSRILKWEKLDGFPTRDGYILSRFGPFLDYEKRGIRIELIDTIAIEGDEYHHLEMTYPDGHRSELFFDVETGLLSMLKPDPGTTVCLYDYRQVGDVLMPHRTEGKGLLPDGRPWHHVDTIVDVKVNSSIDDCVFEPGLR
jgi:hypothetical protein